MELFVKLLIALLLSLLSADLAVAQDAYKWQDDSGRTIYGTKPPKSGAKGGKGVVKNLEGFSTRKLSHYSSKRVLKRTGKLEAAQEIEARISKSADGLDPGLGSSKKKSHKESESIFVEDLIQDSGSNTKKSLRKVSTLLKASEPRVTWSESGALTACEVSIENGTDVDAEEVSVAFRFPNRELIPATGPFSIEAGATGIFVVPSELLPLDLDLSMDAPSEPEVVIHAKDVMTNG